MLANPLGVCQAVLSGYTAGSIMDQNRITPQAPPRKVPTNVITVEILTPACNTPQLVQATF